MKQDIVELNRIAWNRVADHYATSGHSKLTKTFDYFYGQLKPKCRVLGIGLGTGIHFAKVLVDSNFSVIGIDISSCMIQIAR
ncbi:class I SAM-dependent methyltransferase [Candidatus Hodarchaeum mangrovi]